MPDNTNPIPSPLFFAEAAIRTNIATASGLAKIFDLLGEGNTEEALEGFKLLLALMEETDSVLRSVRDICLDAEQLPYYYTPSNRCECGAPLRLPLVWNRTRKTTGKHTCSADVVEFESCSEK